MSYRYLRLLNGPWNACRFSVVVSTLKWQRVSWWQWSGLLAVASHRYCTVFWVRWTSWVEVSQCRLGLTFVFYHHQQNGTRYRLTYYSFILLRVTTLELLLLVYYLFNLLLRFSFITNITYLLTYLTYLLTYHRHLWWTVWNKEL